jgi:hypothetical protein
MTPFGIVGPLFRRWSTTPQQRDQQQMRDSRCNGAAVVRLSGSIAAGCVY